jgi:hypothetical protein
MLAGAIDNPRTVNTTLFGLLNPKQSTDNWVNKPHEKQAFG